MRFLGGASKERLRKDLEREVDRWSTKSVEELQRELEKPLSYFSEAEDHRYQTEVQILDVEKDYVHVSVAVDDLSLWWSIKPLSRNFLVYSDGRVDK